MIGTLRESASSTTSAAKSVENLIKLIRKSQIQSLSIAGGYKSQLRSQILPFLEELGHNTTLTELNISGHMAGNAGATVLSKSLRTNRTLISLDWDNNGTTVVGFRNFKNGLKYNGGHLRVCPLPIRDYTIAVKNESSPQAIKLLETLLTKIERYIHQNEILRNSLAAEQKLVPLSAQNIEEPRIMVHEQMKNSEQALRMIVENKDLALFFREFLHKHYSYEVSY